MEILEKLKKVYLEITEDRKFNKAQSFSFNKKLYTLIEYIYSEHKELINQELSISNKENILNFKFTDIKNVQSYHSIIREFSLKFEDDKSIKGISRYTPGDSEFDQDTCGFVIKKMNMETKVIDLYKDENEIFNQLIFLSDNAAKFVKQKRKEKKKRPDTPKN